MLLVTILVFASLSLQCNCLQPPEIRLPQTRRDVLLTTTPLLTSALMPQKAVAAADPNGLAAKLSKRDASVLKNSVFNIPPSAQVYPKFMHGEWDISLKFAGYLFPSKTIPKDKLTANVNIPGFQKCSIAAIPDVGRELTTYRMKILEGTGLEDRAMNLESTINAHLGYTAVNQVSYDPQAPNRLSIEFIKSRTRNAERIELFCNARESELVSNPDPGRENLSIFVASEYIRQVTFSLSQEFGVARQVVGNYAHFWTWKQEEDGSSLSGNVLTACYLDPQDAMFFQEPSKPVAVYSHRITGKRVF